MLAWHLRVCLIQRFVHVPSSNMRLLNFYTYFRMYMKMKEMKEKSPQTVNVYFHEHITPTATLLYFPSCIAGCRTKYVYTLHYARREVENPVIISPCSYNTLFISTLEEFSSNFWIARCGFTHVYVFSALPSMKCSPSGPKNIICNRFHEKVLKY